MEALEASSSPTTTNITDMTASIVVIPSDVDVSDVLDVLDVLDLVVSPLELYDITNAVDAFTVDGKRVRKTNDTPVIDLISVIDDTDKKQASTIFGRLKNQFYVSTNWSTICGYLKFQ